MLIQLDRDTIINTTHVTTVVKSPVIFGRHRWRLTVSFVLGDPLVFKGDFRYIKSLIDKLEIVN